MAVRGVDKHLKTLGKITGPKMKRAIYAALFAGGDLIRVEAALSIVRGSTQGAGHVPSPPGQPPHRDTAFLDTSIKTDGDPEKLKVEVSSDAPYALRQEVGGAHVDPRSGATIVLPPRPYMQPATDKHRKDVVKLVRRNIRKVLRSKS